MTESERRVDEISRSIGGLEATVKNLTDTWRNQDHEATEGRRRLHAKFDELLASVNRLTGRVDQLSTDLAAMKPSVVLFDQQHQQNIGSKKMLAFVWTAIVACIGSVSYSAVEIVKLFWGKHP